MASKTNQANMRRNVILLIILGFLILFFFPEPQTNFIAYALTALMLFSILIYLIMKQRKIMKS